MRSEKEYTSFNPYMDDCEILYSTAKVLTTRTPHECLCPYHLQYHSIPAGTKVRLESAQVEGSWGKYYTCLACIDWWLDYCKSQGEPEEENMVCVCRPVNGQEAP